MRAAHCLGSPSRTHFSSEVILELYEVCRGDIENERRQAPYLALSTDSWTSHEQQRCAAILLANLSWWSARPMYRGSALAAAAQILSPTCGRLLHVVNG